MEENYENLFLTSSKIEPIKDSSRNLYVPEGAKQEIVAHARTA